MKKLFYIIIVFSWTNSLFGQQDPPSRMNYQAALRQSDGAPIENQTVTLQFHILDNSPSGSSLYTEKHTTTTNEFGLVNLIIGSGQIISGNMNSINWNNGQKWMKVELDDKGGNNFIPLSATELVSVPYALSAGNANRLQNNPVASTAPGTGQVLKWNGTEWVPSNDNTGGGSGPSYIAGSGINIDANNVISNTGDLNNTNEIQSLSLTGNNLSLSNGGGTVTLPVGADNDVTNEIQTLSLSGTVLSLSKGGGSVTLPTGSGGSGDNWGTQNVEISGNTLEGNGTLADPLKLAQQNALNGQVLKNIGNTWVPGNDNDNQNLSISGNQLSITNGIGVALPDASAINEIQTLGISGGSLTLTPGGGTVALPDASATNEIQTLSLSGSSINLSNGGGSVTLPDASTSNEIQNLSISGNTLSLSNGGGSVTLPSGQTYTAGTGISITGNTISNTGDVSNSNEIQTLSLSGSNLTLSNGGGTVGLPNHWSSNGFHIINSNSGAVGIGIQPTSPEPRLWVNGNIRAVNGSIKFGNDEELFDNNNNNTIQISGTFVPSGLDYDLGYSNARWQDLFVKNIDLKDAIYWENGSYIIDDPSYTTSLKVKSSLFPDLSNLATLGKVAYPWDLLYLLTNPIVSSDRRLKDSFQELTYGLNEIKKLNPVKYKLKRRPEFGFQLGLIAQEVKEIIPEIVHGDETIENLGISYSDLSVVLINAIKEQQIQIEELQKKNEALEKLLTTELSLIKSQLVNSQMQK